uniref:Putative secreted protein n=1 Tax=Amblyomma americanum TaxID=6943 RepID=A0A0C9S4S7_AMBAM
MPKCTITKLFLLGSILRSSLAALWDAGGQSQNSLPIELGAPHAQALTRTHTEKIVGTERLRNNTQSLPDALHNPVLLTQRASVILLDPQRHAAVVERVVAFAPHHYTIVLLVFVLTPQAGIHDLNAAYRAGITLYVPAPHSHGVPLFKNKHFVRFLPVNISILVDVIFVCHF